MIAVLSTSVTTKRLATAQARCALWGGVLHALESDDGQPLYVLTRWSLTRCIHGRDGLVEVERFLDAAGAPT